MGGGSAVRKLRKVGAMLLQEGGGGEYRKTVPEPSLRRTKAQVEGLTQSDRRFKSKQMEDT